MAQLPALTASLLKQESAGQALHSRHEITVRRVLEILASLPGSHRTLREYPPAPCSRRRIGSTKDYPVCIGAIEPKWLGCDSCSGSWTGPTTRRSCLRPITEPASPWITTFTSRTVGPTSEFRAIGGAYPNQGTEGFGAGVADSFCLGTCEKDLELGAAVSVDAKTIRVLKLPLRQGFKRTRSDLHIENNAAWIFVARCFASSYSATRRRRSSSVTTMAWR